MNPCHVNGICNNTNGGFSCACREGFSGNGFQCIGKLTISKQSPLLTSPGLTAWRIFYLPLIYGHNHGRLLSKLHCSLLDINECLQPNICHDQASCTNTHGSYMCACNEGYSGDGSSCAG